MSTPAKQLCQTANSNARTRNRRYFGSAVVSFIFIFVLSPALQAANITINGGGAYSTIAAAFAACVAPGNCEIEVPAGTWGMSSTIAISGGSGGTNNILVKCMGIPWIHNNDSRGTTTIQWTGGASPMFTLTTVQGFTMDGCDIDNAGSATKAFSLVSGNHNFNLIDVHSEPTTPFSVSFLQSENGTAANTLLSIQDGYFNNAGGSNGTIDIDHTLNVFIKRSVCEFSAGPSCIRFGNVSQDVAVTLDGFDCETYGARGSSTQACVDFHSASGAVWTGGYCELNEDGVTAAGQLCAKIDAFQNSVTISGVFMNGGGTTNYLISDVGSNSVIKGNFFELCVTAGINRTGFNPVSDFSLVQTLDSCPAAMNTVGIPFANLGTTAPNGIVQYCPDCTIASTCGSGGTGALAKRMNGKWACN